MFAFLNNPATVWVLIPIAAIVVSAFRPMIRARSKEMEAQDARSAEMAARQAERIEHLERRMRVLERIVTDKGLDVAAEIEMLRHTPGIAPARERGLDWQENRL